MPPAAVHPAMRMVKAVEIGLRRKKWLPRIELMTLVAFFAGLIATYFLLSGGEPGRKLLTPPLVAVLLIGNLIPAIALIVLAGRRLAKRRATQAYRGGGGRLHVRLVALFSLIASIPVLLVVVFASLLFQYGVEFWYSDRARTMFENANTMAQTFYAEKQQRIIRETELMASDLSFNLSVAPIDSKPFNENFAYQVYMRELSEAAIVRLPSNGAAQSLALVNPYERSTDDWVPRPVVDKLRETKRTVFEAKGDRMQAITPLPGTSDIYVYAARVSGAETIAQTRRFGLVLKNYNDLVERSRTLQLQFHAALFLITLLIVGIAVWVALNVADRLVKPVGQLVDAARMVTAGNLETRVDQPRSRDEIGILSAAFNRMTETLSAQRRDLLAASELIDQRRAFIEAVLSGVTAGVIAVDANGAILVMNRSASALIGQSDGQGQQLAQLAPELAAHLESGIQDAIINVAGQEGTRTVAVRTSADETGFVLTFDDITARLNDQRRAAWSDVARRVAHEIKNPLTPIQLAAERLKRRFAPEITTDPETFVRLTETIVRQVGDLRRMVDEFSSFARMPKPVFREESLLDISRQAVFLHEVGHPGIAFETNCAEPDLIMICDRRQLGQAVTNLLKNGVEAIEAKGETSNGQIGLTIARSGADLTLEVTDNGIGLPKDRERLAEPYMTTRSGGTGLGLAIVKKIVEEHFGRLSFCDRPGGGTVVTMTFDQNALSQHAQLCVGSDGDEDQRLTELTRAGSV
jgi:two-component system, NtrC family, nitrogen regulation sensor histidine kinase NtrY